jgi:hypothetical protein
VKTKNLQSKCEKIITNKEKTKESDSDFR